MSAATRVLEPGSIETPAGEIPYLLLADSNLFVRRAERLRAHSDTHPLGDYLSFLALLADAQQQALDRLPEPDMTGYKDQERSREYGMPLLSARSWPRHQTWKDGLSMILQLMAAAVVPAATHAVIDSLLNSEHAALEHKADMILAGEYADVLPQELPFIASALQVYWVQMALSSGIEGFGRSEQVGLCPVCGSLPNVGVIRASGPELGLRYLSCSLCSSQWHQVRLTCSSCEATGGISHYMLDSTNGAVKAESCEHCNSYLKLLYQEKEPQLEATADDLATLDLDVLMEQEGKLRNGLNLLFHPGFG